MFLKHLLLSFVKFHVFLSFLSFVLFGIHNIVIVYSGARVRIYVWARTHKANERKNSVELRSITLSARLFLYSENENFQEI